MASAEVQRILDKYPSLKYDKEKQKIICSLTKHEIPATLSAVENYVKGRKFKNAFKKDSYNYEQHKPHIVPSNKKRHLHELFCSLTLRHIARTPEAVERHIRGKRFNRALARWQSCQETGEKFVPRGGQRSSHKTTVSDNESADGGDGFWSDDGGDEAVNDDDMSDLYPAADFSGSACEPESGIDDKNSKYVSFKDLVPAKAQQADDSDSDYDMGVLNGTETEKVTIKADTPQPPVSSPPTNKRKKKNKQKKAVPGSSSDAKKKKHSL
ncbi:hypothetical protein BsWGS_23339 [Bradybaena similaris]